MSMTSNYEWIDEISLPCIHCGFHDELTDETKQTIISYIEQVEVGREHKTRINEVGHRANDAIERLWRVDREACVEWLKKQEGYYRLNSDQLKGETHE